MIAVAAFTAAGLIYGDPRFVGLFEFRNSTRPATDRPGTAAGNRGGSRRLRRASAGARGTGRASGNSRRSRPSASDSYKFLATNDDGTPGGLFALPPAALRGQRRLWPGGRGGPRGGRHRHDVPGHRDPFINDGPTTEAPSEDRAPYQKDAYGDRWAPLLIAWTTPEQAPQLKGPVIGTGGSTHFSFGDGPKSFVTGSLELDAPQIAEDLDRADGAATPPP